jgi:hypothetical protein
MVRLLDLGLGIFALEDSRVVELVENAVFARHSGMRCAGPGHALDSRHARKAEHTCQK